MASNGRRVRDQVWYRSIFHPGEAIKESEVYRSAIRHPPPSTPRGRALTSFQNFFLHLYPVKVPREVLSFRSTLRLGFISTVLFGVLIISGMYLMFFYHPNPPDAYFDMHSLATTVAFGQFVRNIHRWSAHLMVLAVFAHLLRVFYAGAYKPPRQFNWVIGVFLLLGTLFLSFTGYLLPWDQLSLLGDHRRDEHRRLRPADGRRGSQRCCSAAPMSAAPPCSVSTSSMCSSCRR